jgi:acetoin utilization deacetylase AcuC-like enzyme
VAILDWDVHHGNGTQDIFWDDDRVMYASIHQYGPDPGTGLMTYPGTGWVQETGTGGTIINVPLPAGGGEDAYSRALDELVVPAIRGFGPELLLVSAGFDAHARDPLVSMELSAGAYYRFAERLRGIGRGCVLVLEGGYDLEALAWSAGATVSSLLGLAQPAGLPAGEERAGVGEPRAHDWVDAAIEAHRP